jgi:hypothetical protein
MIIDLVNNVVTDRERELKRQNQMLRERIERLEQSVILEEAKREERYQNKNMGPPMGTINPMQQPYYEEDDDDSDDSEGNDGDSEEDSLTNNS